MGAACINSVWLYIVSECKARETKRERERDMQLKRKDSCLTNEEQVHDTCIEAKYQRLHVIITNNE